MPSIAAIVGQLTAAPKPVICLDTCDILEVVQCLGWEKASESRNTACVTAARHLLTTLAVDPDKALVVITELVATEWNQNIERIPKDATTFLTQVDSILDRPYQAVISVGTALPAFPSFSGSTLVNDLVALSTALLNQALRIDLDPALVGLAVERVMTQRRPSHDGHLKDSIHFEHYLELARKLRAAGFGEECVFVSKNRKDFGGGQQSSINDELASEISDPAVRIRFFGSIKDAIGFLHL